MATQLAESFDSGDEGQTEAAIDYEAEARKIGWTPPEEFKGDKSKAVDAKTFYERGKELMPLLKAQNKALETRLAAAEKMIRQSAEHFSKAEERAKAAAIAELRREMAEAVENGDTKAADAVLDRMGGLEKPAAKTESVDEAQRAEEFADWMTENRWYSNDGPAALRIYADAQAEKLKKANNGVLSLDDLNTVADMVKAKYAEAYPEAFGGKKSTTTARNPVDAGGTAPPRRGGKTFADLPPDAQRICDKWVANKIIKSRDDYVKSYAW